MASVCPFGDALFRNASSLYSGNAQGAELPEVAVAVRWGGWVFFKQASCPSSWASAPQQMGPQCLQKLLFPLWEQRLLPLGTQAPGFSNPRAEDTKCLFVNVYLET